MCLGCQLEQLIYTSSVGVVHLACINNHGNQTKEMEVGKKNYAFKRGNRFVHDNITV